MVIAYWLACQKPAGPPVMNASPVFELPPSAMEPPLQPSMADLILRLRLSMRREGDSYRRELLDQLLTIAAQMEERLIEQEKELSNLRSRMV